MKTFTQLLKHAEAMRVRSDITGKGFILRGKPAALRRLLRTNAPLRARVTAAGRSTLYVGTRA